MMGNDQRDLMHLHREICNLDQSQGNHDTYPDTESTMKDSALLGQMVHVQSRQAKGHREALVHTSCYRIHYALTLDL